MGGHKNRGPSGPSMQEQYNTARTGFHGKARDFAAEGGGIVNDLEATDKEKLNAVKRGLGSGNKQGALNAYKQRMEAKFKGAAPGNIRETSANVGAGAGSTNVATAVKPKQILGEEEKRNNSLFV